MDNVNESGIFEAVWERVTEASRGSAPVLREERSEADILAALIASEADNSAFSSTAASRTGASCGALFKSLANVSAKRLGRLQTLYFLLTGNNHHCAHSGTHKQQSCLSALRDAYWRESETASMLISAAGSIGSGKFSSCAADFARQAAANAEQIMQFIDKVMK